MEFMKKKIKVKLSKQRKIWWINWKEKKALKKNYKTKFKI